MASVSRRTFRLGGGEFDHASGDQMRWDARRRFLNAIHSTKPAVLDSLAAEPLSAYIAAMDRLGRPTMPQSWDALTITVDTDDGERGAALAPLRDALATWIRRWALDEPWCLMTVMDTLGVWARVPSWLEAREWATAYAGFLPVRSEEQLFRFEHEGWAPTSDTRQEARASIRRAFERELAAYLDRIAELSAERGFVVTQAKRTDEHFSWLVRVIVDEDSCGEIAREIGKDRRTVEQAVNEAAELIDIPVPHRPN